MGDAEIRARRVAAAASIPQGGVAPEICSVHRERTITFKVLGSPSKPITSACHHSACQRPADSDSFIIPPGQPKANRGKRGYCASSQCYREPRILDESPKIALNIAHAPSGALLLKRDDHTFQAVEANRPV